MQPLIATSARRSPGAAQHRPRVRRVAAVLSALLLALGFLVLPGSATVAQAAESLPAADVLDISFTGGVATDAAQGLPVRTVGAPGYSIDAAVGPIMSSDGNDAVSFDAGAAWPSLLDGYALEAVFRIDASVAFTDERTLFSSKEAGGAALIIRAGQVWGVANIGGRWMETAVPVQADTWYHAVTTWDGATLSLYLDGALVHSVATTGAMAAPVETARHFVVAADSSSNGGINAFAPASSYAAARAYSVPLTAAQAAALAEEWEFDTPAPQPFLDVVFTDGRATDLASGYQPRTYGSPSFSEDPHVGPIMTADGIDDAIGFPINDRWGTFGAGFTLECAFRVNQDMSFAGERTICGSKESGGIGLFLRDGNLWASAHIGGGYITPNVPVSGERWYHAAAVWNGTTFTLYVNGEPAASLPATGVLKAPVATAEHLVIAADSGAGNSANMFSPPASFARVRLYGAALTLADLRVAAAPYLVDDCALPATTDAAVVLDERFCGDSLPDGWTPVSGQWNVTDSRLVGVGARSSASRITFGQPLTDFRLDARIRFESTTDTGSWLAFALDIPRNGSVPWQHAGMRANTTAANSTEFARRNADNSYTVTNQYTRAAATPIGSWVDVAFVVHDSYGEWWHQGVKIGSTTQLVRSGTGIQGLIVDGARIAFDRITISELPPLPPIVDKCVAVGDEIRQPGQAGYAVGHRGEMLSNGLENTIPAFQAAIDKGADWIELDITWTADQEIVVIHDDTVDRTMTGTGVVKQMTLAQFKALDIKGHPGLKAPTFEEALAWMKQTGAKVTIEYKGDFPLELAQKTADLIRQYDVVDQSVALSFSLTTIARMRQVMPELTRHINLSSVPADPVAFAQQYGASSLTWPNPTPPVSVVAALHAAGVKLNSGTTTSTAVWEETAMLGVDAITVNDVAAYQAWLAGYNTRNKYIDCPTVSLEQSDHGTATIQPEGRLLPATEVSVAAQPDEGYVLAGWETTPSGVEVVDGSFAVPSQSVVVRPVFEAVVYRIDYDLAGGEVEGNPTSYTVESGDLVLGAPVRDGYRFTGWTGTGLDGASTEVLIPAGSTGDRSYTAGWEQIAPAWEASQTYDEGDEVWFEGSLWVASWWTRNQTPGDPWGPWQEIRTTEDGTAVWTASRIFLAGEVAVHDGTAYEAKWWTRNQQPGAASGPWRALG